MPVVMHVMPISQSRAGVRADNPGTTFAFSSLIIIAAEPPRPCGEDWAGAEEGGWGRLAQRPLRRGTEEVNLAH